MCALFCWVFSVDGGLEKNERLWRYRIWDWRAITSLVCVIVAILTCCLQEMPLVVVNVVSSRYCCGPTWRGSYLFQQISLSDHTSAYILFVSLHSSIIKRNNVTWTCVLMLFGMECAGFQIRQAGRLRASEIAQSYRPPAGAVCCLQVFLSADW